eukprot:CAMPEP_0168564254 /NCGR_PEP_ID=MMETSP0413-20121227/13142_1 /TAXON_ID=136452 /ORGANISM="Filamoeba nolandi, Strain NC-AS-23-1" /LENGTH=1223 /DNA_ID=CAMNT_0008595903 /DNA_START=52 /DNA_END=3723 /DNA_ORIENTATION=+
MASTIKLHLPSIKLQTDYRSESYVSASGSLSAITRGTDFDVFSVSTSGAVVDVSLSQLFNTNFPGKATVATAVLNPQNQKVLAFASDGAKLYYIDESVKWPTWTQVSSQLDGSTEVIQHIQTFYQNGELLVSVHTKESGSAGAWRFYTVSNILQTPVWTSERLINALTNYQAVHDWVFGATVNTKNGPIVGYLISGPEPGTQGGQWVDGVYLAESGGQRVIKIASGSYTSISTYWDAANSLSYTFGVNGTDNFLYYFQTGVDTPVKVDGVDKLIEVSVTPSARINPNQNILNIFGAAKNQRLVHTWAPLNGSSTLTFDRISYPSTQVVNFATVTDTNNIAKVFAVSSANNLKLVYQDPRSTEWINQTIEVPTPSNVDEFKSYYLSATVVDDQDRPQSFKNFKLYSDISAEIEANGALFQIEEGSFFQNVTNALGRIDLVLRTDSVASPIFSLWVEGMDPTATIAIDPSGDINHQFKNLTSQQLLDAKSQTTGAPLLQGEYHTQEIADQLAQSITHVMGIANSTAFAGLKAAPRHIGKGSARQVTEHVRHTFDQTTNPNRIHVGSAPKKHFKIDFRGKYPVFSSLSDLEVQQHFQAAKAKAPQQRAALARNKHLLAGKHLLGGIFDWDWGDVWGMIEDGVGTLVDVVVSVGENISAVVNVIIDTVEQAFQTVIEFVQQAFDVVEAVFEKVKIFFEEIWQWLCFLFDWSDIENTQTVIKYYINQSVDYIHDIVVNDGTLVTQQVFSTIKDKTNSLFDSAITAVTGVNVNSGGQGSNPLGFAANAGNLQDSALPDLPSAADWFLNKVLNFFSDDSWNIPDHGLGSLLQSFLDTAQNCGAIDQVKNALSALQDFFTGQWTTEASVWDAALVTILTVAKSLVLAVLDAIEALVTIFLQLIGGGINLVKNILNADIDIPVVSWIFKKIFGFEMSMLDVFSLIIALPATIAYKISNGRAPFTDQQVKTITSGRFTGPPLPPTTSSANLHEVPHKAPILAANDPTLQQTLLVLAGWGQIINVPFDMAQDVPGGIAEYAKVIKVGAVVIPMAIQMLRVPLWIFNQSWSDQPDYVKWQIGGWISGWVAPVSTIVCFIATKGEKGLRGFAPGRIFLALIGAVQLGVNITTGVLMEQSGKANHHTWINQIVGPINNLAKPLALSKNPYAIAALQLIDLVTNLTVGINTIVQGRSLTIHAVFHENAAFVSKEPIKEPTHDETHQHIQQKVQKAKHA